MFESIITAGTLTMGSALLCTAASLALGGLVALVYRLQGQRGNTLFVTLFILPAIVQTIIMLVNGSVGTGVAVAGAFSLVRFRSVPGNARDILCLFYAMAIGLATGMGYLAFAAVFAVVIGLAMVLVGNLPFLKAAAGEKQLNITIPEQLDYADCFTDIFSTYTRTATLENVKTTNMGTLFQLTYLVRLKNEQQEKEMLDAIRTRNGNLTVQCARTVSPVEAL